MERSGPMGEPKRRRIDHEREGESYFVLIGGECLEAQGSPLHAEREFQHTSVPFVGQGYKRLREAGIPRDRIITICQLDDYRSTLLMGEEGQFTGRDPKFYRKQRNETDRQCQLLIEEGGADYDFELVNPETVWCVLGGEQSAAHSKVVPRSCSALFFAVYSHGDSHAADGLVTGDGQGHDHLTAEWYVHFPYPSRRRDIYDFVATEGAGGKAPYHLYSTQLRLIFHRLFAENPSRPIVGLLNYCTSGGNLEFMRRPTVVRSLGVDQWPLFLMSSSGKSADSLVAGLWESVFQLLAESLLGENQHTFGSLFDAAVSSYHKENVYDLLNECKERAFSGPVWELDFKSKDNKSSYDPWHIDLSDCLLGLDGKPNVAALQELQDAYTSGKAFRIVHCRHARGQDSVAQVPGKPEYVVVWARSGDKICPHPPFVQWRKIEHSRPFRCPITAWQGDNTGCEVDLPGIALEAFATIAKPEFVCGDQSGIREAKVTETFGRYEV